MGELGEQPKGVKRLRLRYAGTCRGCGTKLDAGVTADYDRGTKTVHCIVCPSTRSQPVARQTPEPQASGTSPLGWVVGEAGASAAREFERRRDKRHERVLSGHPRLGKLLLAVFDEPQSTKAWGQGAAGEETVGASLRAISSESLRVLNDRRIPGSRANIDHLVVTAHGVYVIDAKRYVGSAQLGGLPPTPNCAVSGGWPTPIGC